MSDTGWSAPNQLSGSGPAHPYQLSDPRPPSPEPPLPPPDPRHRSIRPRRHWEPDRSEHGRDPAGCRAGRQEAPSLASGLVQIAVIAAIAVAALVFRDRLSCNASDLRVGDCFDEPSGTATEVKDVQHHPCTEPHDGEVFFVGNHPDAGTYPGGRIRSRAVEKCVPAFEAYVGRDYETDKEYDFGGFFPIQDGWSSGDHDIDLLTSSGSTTRS